MAGDLEPRRIATVFGGTGFLGRRIVEALLDCGYRVRVAARNPGRSRPPHDAAQRMEPVQADIRDTGSVIAAVDGADAVANAVSLYAEGRALTFHTIHVEGAGRVAEASRDRGVRKLVQISGIGADPVSRSRYIRCRAEGEIAVRRAFDDAAIVRPSVMFGPDDSLLNTLIPMVRRFPVLPLFGLGRTRLQPVYVGDVATAVSHLLTDSGSGAQIYELGGPEIYTYRQLLKRVAAHTTRRPLLAPLPFAVWEVVAAAARLLPNPPLTGTQVALMRRDNVAAPDMPSFAELDIRPTAIETVLSDLIDAKNQPAGQTRNGP